jgi:hypothetical protein
MSFLSLPGALAMAAVAVPLLLLLYFLKLRRQPRRVTSTLLWKRAVEDLQVNAPFQRLRRNLLLFLQLLILAAVLFGLAGPVANLTRRPQRSVVLLIDHSGSMKALEADGRTRLEHARDAAISFVSQLPADSRAMVISFADRATVTCSFTTDRRRLQRLISGIATTDAPSRMAEALQLAVAYSSSLVEDSAAGVPAAALQGSADIELFSDGRVADADRQFVTRGQMRYFRVGAAADNVGIVAFDVRRDFERPGVLSVFARVENFGPTAVTADLSLSLDGRLLPGSSSVRELTLGPASTPTSGPARPPRPDDPSQLPSGQGVVFELGHQAGGVLEVRWHRDDALAADNVVYAPIDPPRPLRVLAVCDRPPVEAFLRKFMQGFGVAGFEVIGNEEYEKLPEDRLVTEGRCLYDLVILDGHDTDRLPPGSYLFFNGLPRVAGISREGEVVAKPIVFGRQNHPLLRSVNYDGIDIARWKRLQLPPHALPLLEGEDSPVMALVADPGHQYLITAFDLLDSDLFLSPSFPILLQNVLGFLCGGGLTRAAELASPGDTIHLPVPAGATRARITRPGGQTEDLDVVGRAHLTFARTQETGVYQARFDDAADSGRKVAVNLLDPNESRISPAETFAVGAEEVAAVDASVEVNQALWPHAVAAALIVLLLEWWVYNRRVMI